MVNQKNSIANYATPPNIRRALKQSPGIIPREEPSQQPAPFVITRKLLGKGTNSEVYLGYDSNSFQKLAIKIVNMKKLSANSKLKLQKEIEILTKLKSQSTSNRFVKIHKTTSKSSDTNDIFFLAMEFVVGCDLYVLCSEYSLGIPETLTKKNILQHCFSDKRIARSPDLPSRSETGKHYVS